MSLGLGLTVLVAIALIEGNLSRQVSQSLPEEAPGFYFIDIQPDQVEDFNALVKSFPGVSELQQVPMLRGRIAAVNGVRSEEHTSELQSLMRISYAVFCLKKKKYTLPCNTLALTH